jgi:L-lactate permease
MRFVYLWFIAGIALISFAVVRFTTQDVGGWALPTLVGGIACLAGGLYQLWWEKTVFDEDPRSARFPSWLLRPPHSR